MVFSPRPLLWEIKFASELINYCRLRGSCLNPKSRLWNEEEHEDEEEREEEIEDVEVPEEDEEHHEVDSRVEVEVIEDEVDRGKVSRRRYFDIINWLDTLTTGELLVDSRPEVEVREDSRVEVVVDSEVVVDEVKNEMFTSFVFWYY